jgi:hypothetical protein
MFCLQEMGYEVEHIAFYEVSTKRTIPVNLPTYEDKQRFEQYLSGQIAKITLDNKDEAYLRERILTMYANPARNKGKSE